MRVLAVSPHLDDAAFSVGGVLALLAEAGHSVTVVTCFTASVPEPSGFALSCQTDKGLGADVDYMALRRAEDSSAMDVLGVSARHLPFPEAPHRGYESAAALFTGVLPGDVIWQEVADALAEVIDDLGPDLVLAPQGLGGHVDHLHVVRAVAALSGPTAWWRDAPYVLRQPDATPAPDLPEGLTAAWLPSDVRRRADACACYVTQLGYQFGRDSHLPAEEAMRVALARLDEPLLCDGGALDLLRGLQGCGTG